MSDEEGDEFHDTGAREVKPPTTTRELTGFNPSYVNTRPRGAAADAHPPGPSTPKPLESTLPYLGAPGLVRQTNSTLTGAVTTTPTTGTTGSTERIVHVLREDHLRSWNLKFSGDSDVTDFFLRIDDYRRSRDTPERKVLKCFADLLSGKALDYYRHIRDGVSSLSELQDLFRSFFTSIDNDYTLEKTIREHRQSPGQSLHFYILEMQTMNARLTTKLSETTLLQIIKHNILPSYGHLLAVDDSNSIQNLIAIGKRFEAYSGLPGSTNNSKTTKQIKQINEIKTYNQRNFKSNNTQRQVNNKNNQLTCKKCKKSGHSYQQCRTIPGIVCFQCGQKNVLTSTCHKCNPAKGRPAPEADNAQKN